MLSDYHIHSTYSDGNNSPEEMVLSAIEKGLESMGISDHSYTFFDESYCMRETEIENYRAEINALKEKYKDRIEVLCGIEQDLYSDEPADAYDYSIVSMHYMYVDNGYHPVDEAAYVISEMVNDHFDGDWYAAAEEYYRQISEIKKADIIGHFDLIAKFNEQEGFFDEKDPRYVSAWKKAVDKLLLLDIPFEINTGAIARGYRSVPYPSPDMIEYIRSKGGKFTLSSDSHSTETIAFDFEKYINML